MGNGLGKSLQTHNSRWLQQYFTQELPFSTVVYCSEERCVCSYVSQSSWSEALRAALFPHPIPTAQHSQAGSSFPNASRPPRRQQHLLPPAQQRPSLEHTDRGVRRGAGQEGRKRSPAPCMGSRCCEPGAGCSDPPLQPDFGEGGFVNRPSSAP